MTISPRRFGELLDEVRRIPGYAGFLAPTPFHELQQAAQAGPVIIVNISAYRCDAMIVTLDRVRTVPLTSITHNDCVTQANTFLGTLYGQEQSDLDQTLGSTLAWLWDSIAEPILGAMGYAELPDAPLPRVWWCPTGPLTVLPLHAAGRAGQPSLADRAISSYTTTLSALIRARSRPSLTSTPRLLAVGVGQVPGLSVLPAVETEAQTVAALRDDATLLTGPEATQQAVLERLVEHTWIHLACHGVQDMNDPSQGAIQLHDKPLSVLRIAAERMEHAELAFLSACQTATTGVQLPDEAIHLAAAFQLVGYRHVIASLWPIRDSPTRTVVQRVYQALAAEGVPCSTHAALALHNAVQELRHKYPANPAVWAPYVHTGP